MSSASRADSVMNAIGIDLNAVGNHEFDHGVDELKRLAQGGCAPASSAHRQSCPRLDYTGARFPFLAANVLDRSTGQPIFAPTFVKSFDGVRIGFIGVVTRSTPGIVIPSGVAGVRFLAEARALNEQAKALQDQGVQAIVAVVHEGGDADGHFNACANPRGAIFDIERELDPAIDVVLSAHTPHVLLQPDLRHPLHEQGGGRLRGRDVRLLPLAPSPVRSPPSTPSSKPGRTIRTRKRKPSDARPEEAGQEAPAAHQAGRELRPLPPRRQPPAEHAPPGPPHLQAGPPPHPLPEPGRLRGQPGGDGPQPHRPRQLVQGVAQMKSFIDTHIIFPLWTLLTHWMGYSICIWTPKDLDEIRVIHLYDTEWNIRRSMQEYLG